MCHRQKESICHFHTRSVVCLLCLLTAQNIRLLALQRNDAVIHDAFSANKGDSSVVSYFFLRQNRFIFGKKKKGINLATSYKLRCWPLHLLCACLCDVASSGKHHNIQFKYKHFKINQKVASLVC